MKAIMYLIIGLVSLKLEYAAIAYYCVCVAVVQELLQIGYYARIADFITGDDDERQ